MRCCHVSAGVIQVEFFNIALKFRSCVSNFFTDLKGLATEEQPPDLIRQIVIAHHVDLPLIESSNGVEFAVDEIQQVRCCYPHRAICVAVEGFCHALRLSHGQHPRSAAIANIKFASTVNSLYRRVPVLQHLRNVLAKHLFNARNDFNFFSGDFRRQVG